MSTENKTSSLIIFPVYYLLAVLVVVQSLHPFILRLHEPIPVCPVRMVILEGFVFIWIPLVIGQHLV